MYIYALKEIRRRKGKYLLNILAMALAVFLLITLNALGSAYNTASTLPFTSIQSSMVVQRNGNVPENTSGVVLSCSLAPINSKQLPEVRKIDGVKDVSSGLVLWVFDDDGFKRVVGIGNDSFGRRIASKTVNGNGLPSINQALVEKTYLVQHDLNVGQDIKISGKKFTISGIVDSSGKNLISADAYISLDAAQELAYASKNLQSAEKFDKTDVNVIFVDADQTKLGEVVAGLNNTLESYLPEGETPTGQTNGLYNIYTPKTFEKQIASVALLSDKLITGITLITLIGAALIILRSMSQSMLERRREFGIMKAVGFRIKDLQKEVFAETVIQTVAGYVIGVLLSLIAVFALSTTTIKITLPWELDPYPHFLSADLSTANTVITYPLPISFPVDYALLCLGIIFVVTMAVMMVSIRRIGRLKTIEVLRYE